MISGETLMQLSFAVLSALHEKVTNISMASHLLVV